jgi:hypothetical protein
VNPAETIALASVISSGAVGVAAVIGSVVGGWRDRVNTRNVQREDRRQERLQQAYEALIAYVEKRIRIAARLRPLLSYPNDPPPPTITDEEIERAQALVDIHASPEVDRLICEFSGKLREIENAEFALRMNDDRIKTRGQDLDPTDLGSKAGPSRTSSSIGAVSTSSGKSRTAYGSRCGTS